MVYFHTQGNKYSVFTFYYFCHNSGPREDATRIGSAGVVRRQAVDISPLRRVNQAIYLLTTGARESAFRNIKTIAECLADELINAAKGSSNRYLRARLSVLYTHTSNNILGEIHYCLQCYKYIFFASLMFLSIFSHICDFGH